MGAFTRDGFRFDTGPTLVLMREPLERLFAELNESLEHWLDLHLVEPSYLVRFGDGSHIYSSSCVARMVREITRLAGADAVPGYLRLLADISKMHHEAIPLFVRRYYRSWRDLAGVREVFTLQRHHLLARMYRHVGRYVRDPRLRQLFTFQSMYLGLSPIEAPWVYATLTYMECGEGVWYPMGGDVSDRRRTASDRRTPRCAHPHEHRRAPGQPRRWARNRRRVGIRRSDPL